MPGKRRKILWFVAIIPPEPIRSEIWEMKLEMEARYNSRKSLSSPPHITLVAPFKYEQQNISHVEDVLRDQVRQSKAFYVELNGFAAFPPRVLFVKPEKNEELERLWSNMNEALKSLIPIQVKNVLRAHMTIATRDLHKEQYKKAAEYFLPRKYNRFFQTDKIYLLKHSGLRWDIYGEYKFNEQ